MNSILARIATLSATAALAFASPASAGVTTDTVPPSYAGYVTAAGAIGGGTGYTVSHTGTGTYVVTYPAAKFTRGFPAMTVTGWGENGIVPVAVLYYASCSSGSCNFGVNTFSSSGVATDNGFVFTIIQAK